MKHIFYSIPVAALLLSGCAFFPVAQSGAVKKSIEPVYKDSGLTATYDPTITKRN